MMGKIISFRVMPLKQCTNSTKNILIKQSKKQYLYKKYRENLNKSNPLMFKCRTRKLKRVSCQNIKACN